MDNDNKEIKMTRWMKIKIYGIIVFAYTDMLIRYMADFICAVGLLAIIIHLLLNDNMFNLITFKDMYTMFFYSLGIEVTMCCLWLFLYKWLGLKRE